MKTFYKRLAIASIFIICFSFSGPIYASTAQAATLSATGNRVMLTNTTNGKQYFIYEIPSTNGTDFSFSLPSYVPNGTYSVRIGTSDSYWSDPFSDTITVTGSTATDYVGDNIKITTDPNSTSTTTSTNDPTTTTDPTTDPTTPTDQTPVVTSAIATQDGSGYWTISIAGTNFSPTDTLNISRTVGTSDIISYNFSVTSADGKSIVKNKMASYDPTLSKSSVSVISSGKKTSNTFQITATSTNTLSSPVISAATRYISTGSQKKITVTGSKFIKGQLSNIIQFYDGDGTIVYSTNGIASADGSTLSLTVPNSFANSDKVATGTYSVRVINSAGSSNVSPMLDKLPSDTSQLSFSFNNNLPAGNYNFGVATFDSGLLSDITSIFTGSTMKSCNTFASGYSDGKTFSVIVPESVNLIPGDYYGCFSGRTETAPFTVSKSQYHITSSSPAYYLITGDKVSFSGTFPVGNTTVLFNDESTNSSFYSSGNIKKATGVSTDGKTLMFTVPSLAFNNVSTGSMGLFLETNDGTTWPSYKMKTCFNVAGSDCTGVTSLNGWKMTGLNSSSLTSIVAGASYQVSISEPNGYFSEPSCSISLIKSKGAAIGTLFSKVPLSNYSGNLTVPATTTVGTYTVQPTCMDGLTARVGSSLPLTVISSSLSSLSPTSGFALSTVTATGKNFATSSQPNVVTIVDSKNAVVSVQNNVSAVSATSLKFNVPNLADGTYKVSVNNSSQISFKVISSSATSLTPTSGIQGSNITIKGSNLITGSKAILSQGMNKITLAPSSMNASSMTVPLPAISAGSLMASGLYNVAIIPPTGTTTSSLTFTLNIPTITGISPASTTVGSSMTIKGKNMSTVNNVITFTNSKTSFTATQKASSATSLTLKVPSLSLGAYQVSVNGSNALTFEVSKTVGKTKLEDNNDNSNNDGTTPTPTPVVTATPTPTVKTTPTPTPTPTITTTPKPTVTATPVATVKVTTTATPSPTVSVLPTASPSVTATPVNNSNNNPVVVPSATPTATPTATASPLPVVTASPSATVTATPSATAVSVPLVTSSPSPSATATPTSASTPTAAESMNNYNDYVANVLGALTNVFKMFSF